MCIYTRNIILDNNDLIYIRFNTSSDISDSSSYMSNEYNTHCILYLVLSTSLSFNIYLIHQFIKINLIYLKFKFNRPKVFALILIITKKRNQFQAIFFF